MEGAADNRETEEPEMIREITGLRLRKEADRLVLKAFRYERWYPLAFFGHDERDRAIRFFEETKLYTN